MRQPITKRKKVSFMNFVKEVSKYRTDNTYMSVSLEYDHHTTSEPKMVYGAYFNGVGHFKDSSPEGVLKKLQDRFAVTLPTEIKDVFI